MKQQRRMNISMCLAGILFCLTLISIHLTSGLYARYYTAASSGDSARVIKFGKLTLTETGDFTEEGKLTFIPGVDLYKKAVISFEGSEAATYVFLEIIPSGWIMNMNDDHVFSIISNQNAVLQWNVEADWKYLLNEDGVYVYYQEVSTNTAFEENVIANDGKILVSENLTQKEINNLPASIAIKIRATVVQAGGFETPKDAWDSIAAKEGV